MLPHFIAQLPTDSVPSLSAWILGASGAVFLINQALTFYKEHMRVKPEPADTYATKAEHTELKGRVDNADAKIETNFRELDRKRSVSIAGLHDDLAAKTEALRSEMKSDNERLHDRITDVLAKVSELKGQVQK